MTATAPSARHPVRWAAHTHFLASVWAGFVAVLGAYWWCGGAGFPFGRNDADGPDYGALLTGADSEVVAPLMTIYGLLVLGLLRRLDPRDDSHPPHRSAIAAAAVVIAVLGLALLTDARLIMLLPPLGLLPVKWVEIDWPSLFQVLVAIGSSALLLTGAAQVLGRPELRAKVGARLAGPGRAATWVAVLCPLPYALIRLCWSRGWAVGAPAPFVDSLLRNQPENVWIEPILATFAIGGSVLTWGLLRPWGRVFPRWMPVLGGRTVAIWFPLGFGGCAALSVWGFGRPLLQGRLGVDVPGGLSQWQAWGQPQDGWTYWGADGLGWLLFPLWAGSLTIALVAYFLRVRDGADGPG